MLKSLPDQSPRGKTVRLNLRHQDMVRAKIKTSVIVDRLVKHIDGKIELSTTQVQAARILLDRTIPTLTSTELSGPGGKDLAIQLQGAPNDSRV